MGRQAYHAFLLRLWRVDGGGRAAWRASLEDAHSGERHGFSDLPALQSFLQAQLEAHAPERAEPSRAETPEVARPPVAEK